MEGDLSARAAHGTDLDPDCSRDVPARDDCVRLTVAYDGTAYFGWQKTPFGPSIQQELETAWEKIFQQKISMDAISRTDRGVHAKGQIVQFQSPCKLPEHRLILALNAHLPKDIRINHVRFSSTFFQPISKTYRYSVHLNHTHCPINQHYAWHYPYPVDLPLLTTGAQFLIGTHDFSAFSTEAPVGSIRTIHSIDIQSSGTSLDLFITGDRFLYKMARTIAGTLLNLSSGKLSKETFYNLFITKQRALAGMTAPAHGLCLERITGV